MSPVYTEHHVKTSHQCCTAGISYLAGWWCRPSPHSIGHYKQPVKVLQNVHMNRDKMSAAARPSNHLTVILCIKRERFKMLHANVSHTSTQHPIINTCFCNYAKNTNITKPNHIASNKKIISCNAQIFQDFIQLSRKVHNILWYRSEVQSQHSWDTGIPY